MIYERIEPSAHLKRFIESFWLVDSEGNSEEEQQKIIPDGFPELIIHYGDPYQIKLGNSWQFQSRVLLAGQIRNHFFLKNSGVSGMIGVKFMPAAASLLFELDMASLTDSVVNPEHLSTPYLSPFSELSPSLQSKSDSIQKIEAIVENRAAELDDQLTTIEVVVSQLLDNTGLMSIGQLSEVAGVGERQLERLFAKHIGLSPKFYSRVIRLGHVFQLMQSSDNSWSDLVYGSGFYDQSHFIKNFKEFTGEDPSSYGFDEKNMANFHLKK